MHLKVCRNWKRRKQCRILCIFKNYLLVRTCHADKYEWPCENHEIVDSRTPFTHDILWGWKMGKQCNEQNNCLNFRNWRHFKQSYSYTTTLHTWGHFTFIFLMNDNVKLTWDTMKMIWFTTIPTFQCHLEVRWFFWHNRIEPCLRLCKICKCAKV